MDVAEIEQLISDLETQVERLRALYDQYFMGLERIEPLIMRKDIDRRLWMLRREQIRNTGLRFKLQNTVQRYNTYQQYWQRIVREIENGTYQRDLGRAARRFGEQATTAIGRRRQKMFEKGMAKRAERDARRRSTFPPSAGASGPPAAPLSQFPPLDVTFEDSDVSPSPVAIPPPPEPLELDMDLGDSPAPLAAVPVPRPGAGAPAPPRPLPVRRALGFPERPIAAAAPFSVPLPAAPRSPQGALPAAPPAAALPMVAPPTPRRPAAALPALVPRAPSRPEPPSDAPDELSPARMRQIYGQYVDAKRRANESTAAITYDKIAATLKQSADALRAKHKGRSVDFEVILKDGKPILKPVVKG